MKKKWIDYDPDGPIEPTKIIAKRKLIRIIRRELIFNGSLQKVNTEKALKIIQNDNKIDLKGKDKNQWAKDGCASLRAIMRVVDQNVRKVSSADWLAQLQLENLDTSLDDVTPLAKKGRPLERQNAQNFADEKDDNQEALQHDTEIGGAEIGELSEIQKQNTIDPDLDEEFHYEFNRELFLFSRKPIAKKSKKHLEPNIGFATVGLESTDHPIAVYKDGSCAICKIVTVDEVHFHNGNVKKVTSGNRKVWSMAHPLTNDMISVCFRQDWDPLIVIVDSSEKFLCSTRADAFKEDKAGGRPEAEAFMIKLATDFCHNAVGLLGEPIDVNNLREEKKKRILAAGLPTKLPSNRNTKKTSAKERKRAGGAPPQIEAASGSTVASSAVAAAASSGAAVAASCGAHVPKQKVKAAAKPKRVAKRALSDGSPFGPALDEPPHQRRWKNLIEFLEAPGVGDGNQAPKGAAAAPAIPTVGDATPPTPEIAAPTPPLSRPVAGDDDGDTSPDGDTSIAPSKDGEGSPTDYYRSPSAERHRQVPEQERDSGVSSDECKFSPLMGEQMDQVGGICWTFP